MGRWVGGWVGSYAFEYRDVFCFGVSYIERIFRSQGVLV